jgi:hypothetical protein
VEAEIFALVLEAERRTKQDWNQKMDSDDLLFPETRPNTLI